MSHWADPSLLDRVDGRFRGAQVRDNQVLKDKLKSMVSLLDVSEPADLNMALMQMFASVGELAAADKIVDLLEKSDDQAVQVSAIRALGQLNYERLEQIVVDAMRDGSALVRATAIGLLNQVEIGRDEFELTMRSIFQKGTVAEQQQLLKVLSKMDTATTNAVFENLISDLEKGQLNPELHLDLSEAIVQTHSTYLQTKITVFTDQQFSNYEDALLGGSIANGREYYNEGSAGQCRRCHSTENGAIIVGPNLGNIGSVLSRQQLLEALVEPSKRLAPGYGVVIITLQGGQVVSGILMEENDEELLLKTSEAEPLRVPIERIQNRENMASSMPPMGQLMTKREIRDVVAFLASLKED
jgi:quinoprotein glucose dehydrogenase